VICNARDTIALSDSVARLLSRYVFRRRIVSLISALGVGCAVFLTIVLVAVLLDRLFAFPRPVRIAELTAAIAVLIAILIRPLVRLTWRFDTVDAAIAIESSTSIFDQRLVTVVSHAASNSMAAQLNGEVESLARQPGAQPRLSLRPLVRPVAAALVMILVIASLWSIPRLGLPRLLSRLFHPLTDISPVTATRLAVLPGNTAVIDGRPLTITADVQSKMLDEPTLHLSDDGRTWTPWPMFRDEQSDASKFGYTLPAVDHDWRYFVTAGDATSAVFTVSILRPPTVAEFRIHGQPPGYLHQPASNFTSTDGQIELSQGSQVTVEFVCTEPVRQLQLKSPARQLETSATADVAVRQAHFTVTNHEAFTVRLTGENGMTNSAARLVIHPLIDRPPVAHLLEPVNLSQISSGEEISAHYLATDDHGLSQLTLEARCIGASSEQIVINVPADSRNLEGNARATFRNHRPVVGDVITLRLLAKDLAGQTANSEAVYMLVCPPVADRVPITFLMPLLDASAAADRLSAQLESAADAIEQSDLQRANNSLSDAAETAPILERSLFRMLRASTSSDQAEAICNLIDAAAICRATIEEIINSPIDPPAGIALLSRTAVNREQLSDSLRLMKEGRQSAVILADQTGLAGFDSAEVHRTAATARRVSAIRNSAEDQLADKIRELGLDPLRSDIFDQLSARVIAEQSMYAAASPIDFPIPGKTTDRVEQKVLAARLMAAAKAETLRPDGDLARANELAARSVSLTPRPGSPPAMLLAFRANAAAFRKDDAQTDSLDAERRRAVPRSDREASIAKLTAIHRTLQGLADKLDRLAAFEPDLASEAFAVANASNLAMRDAAVERLLAVNALSPLVVESSRR
jgi:hypothetical protein